MGYYEMNSSIHNGLSIAPPNLPSLSPLPFTYFENDLRPFPIDHLQRSCIGRQLDALKWSGVFQNV